MRKPRSEALAGGVIVLIAGLVGSTLATGLFLVPLALTTVAALLAILHRPSWGLWVMFLLLPLVPGFPFSPLERAVDYLFPAFLFTLILADPRLGPSRLRPLPRGLMLWFAAFIFWTLFISFFAASPALSFAQAFRYSLILAILIVVWNLWDMSALGRGMLLISFVLVLVAAYGLWEFLTAVENRAIQVDASQLRRFASFYNNENILAVWLGHGVIILGAYLLSRPHRPWTLLRANVTLISWVMVFVLLACAVTTYSRASYLYIVFGLLTLVSAHRTLRWIAFAGFSAAGAALLAGPLPGWVVLGLRLQSSGASYRGELWSSGLKMMLDHPWTGVGTGSGVFAAHRPMYITTAADRGLLDIQSGGAHNVFITRGAEMGVLGLLLALALFVMLWSKVPGAMRAYRAGDWLAGAAAAGVVGLSVRALFERSATLGLGDIADSLVFFLFALILFGRASWKPIDAEP